MLEIFSDPNVVAGAEFISDAMKTSLSEKLLIVGVVWFAMGGKVKKLKEEMQAGVTATMDQLQNHFSMIEKGLSNVADEVSDLKKTVANDLAAQSARLSSVETGIDKLNTRVGTLEQTKAKL